MAGEGFGVRDLHEGGRELPAKRRHPAKRRVEPDDDHRNRDERQQDPEGYDGQGQAHGAGVPFSAARIIRTSPPMEANQAMERVSGMPEAKAGT